MFGSLFDFAKDVGAKLFTSDEEAAENILAHIQENNPGVDPIQVAYDDGCVTLTGTASDDAAKEKCVLIAGNVEGVEKVVADDLVVPPPPPPPPVRYYTIQKGDTLWAIASEAYGNGARYTEIVEANKEVIIDADKIYPGQKIRIP